MAKKRTTDQTEVFDEPAVIDGSTGSLVPRHRRIRLPLSSLLDTRRYVARVIRRVESGELTVEQGNGRVFMARVLAGIISDADLERRLDTLEKQQARLLPDALRQLPGE